MMRFTGFVCAAAAVITLLLFCGCTDYERKGMSPLPHNRPADWESRPWGQQGFQN